ncbi:MAG TPA: hypothetical protein VMT46_05010 [Anaerolineaceae bacterium]|nr:hypothetical protein [Anaerolineaceae bacterium]
MTTLRDRVQTHRPPRLVLFLILPFLVGGCSGIAEYILPPNAAPAQTTTAIAAQTQTLTAKTTPSQFGTISSQACLETDLAAMQSNSPALDQLLWLRQDQSLIYIAPSKTTSWYTGDLTRVSPPHWKDPVLLASNVVGSLALSPGGNAVAFAALRVEEGVYTVMTVDLETLQVNDLFPGDAAKEDHWSSPKYVLDWSSDGSIDVLSNCGLDCQRLQRVSSGGMVESRELKGAEALKISLLPHTQVKELNETDHPSWSHPNWSPDGKRVVFTDLKGVTWVFSPAKMTQYILESPVDPDEETRWSTDGTRLAIRNHGRIAIYRIDCQP